MIKAVLFDLGGTLAQYYERFEFPAILDSCVEGAAQCLYKVTGVHGEGKVSFPDPKTIFERTANENFEAEDLRVRPLENRLAKIFKESAGYMTDELTGKMCDAFLAPIYARGMIYPDAPRALDGLRSRGYTLGLISNTPWGSPSEPWRNELRRLEIHDYFDCALFCRDVGWRKPAPPLFLKAAESLGLSPHECLFVGDHPKWDIEGSETAGMRALLINRTTGDADETCIRNRYPVSEVNDLDCLPVLVDEMNRQP